MFSLPPKKSTTRQKHAHRGLSLLLSVVFHGSILALILLWPGKEVDPQSVANGIPEGTLFVTVQGGEETRCASNCCGGLELTGAAPGLKTTLVTLPAHMQLNDSGTATLLPEEKRQEKEIGTTIAPPLDQKTAEQKPEKSAKESPKAPPAEEKEMTSKPLLLAEKQPTPQPKKSATPKKEPETSKEHKNKPEKPFNKPEKRKPDRSAGTDQMSPKTQPGSLRAQKDGDDTFSPKNSDSGGAYTGSANAAGAGQGVAQGIPGGRGVSAQGSNTNAASAEEAAKKYIIYLIKKYQIYASNAVHLKAQGIVRVRVTVASSGMLENICILECKGPSVLEQSAERMIALVQEHWERQPVTKGFSVTVPVQYVLKKRG